MNLQEAEKTARLHLNIFEDIMLYGVVRDGTLGMCEKNERKLLKQAYEKVYLEREEIYFAA